MIEFSVNTKDLERNYREQVALMPKALKKGLNEAGKHVNKQMPRIISQHTGLKMSTIRKLSGIKRATTSNLRVDIVLIQRRDARNRVRPFGLHHFSPRPRQNKQGVSGSPYRKREFYKSAFIVKSNKVPNLDGKVMRRKGKKRNPILAPALVRPIMVRGVFHDADKNAMKKAEESIKKSLTTGSVV